MNERYSSIPVSGLGQLLVQVVTNFHQVSFHDAVLNSCVLFLKCVCNAKKIKESSEILPVADPGYPRGAPIPKARVPTYHLAFFLKTAWN